MLKLTLAAVAIALLTPALANAATTTKMHGVVVAKERSRHVLVVASSHGKVTSARVSARRFRAIPIRTRLALAGTKLADGSVRVTRIRKLGRAQHARLRVTVVKAHARKLLVAGGGTAFAIKLRRGTRFLAGKGSGLQPGDEIEAEVALGKSGPVGSTVQQQGQSTLIDFSGTVTALDATSLTISSDGVTTIVQIPDGVSLPQLVQLGSEVEIVASISGTTLTLVEIKLDGNGETNGDNGGSSVSGEASVDVEGFVTALDASSITIQPGDSASPVTFAVPAGFTLPAGLATGSQVEAKGDLVNNVLTLTKLELQNDQGQTEVETEGTVTALDASSITIQPAESGTPLTFAIPSGFTLPAGLQVGSLVDAKGETAGGTLTLTKLELQSESDGQVEAEGTVTALDSSSITIQTQDSSTPVTYSTPAGFTLPNGLQVGSVVDAKGGYVSGVLTLSEIEVQDQGSGGSGGGDG